MQTMLLPYDTYSELDNMIRNFMWGSSMGKKKVHLLAWGQVCCCKDKKGLGIWNLRLNNETFFMEATFKLMGDN